VGSASLLNGPKAHSDLITINPTFTNRGSLPLALGFYR